MTVTYAAAPGKLVLSGEYAVLHGAHAIAAAVSRYARVTLQPLDEPRVELSTPGFCNGTRQYRVAPDGQLEAQGAHAAQGIELFEETWNACRPPLHAGARITLDTREFCDPGTGIKLGLGSSSALCVALTAALQPDAAQDVVAMRARDIHVQVQGGGSGVDVACAAHGGIIDFGGDVAGPATVSLPGGLCMAVLWSGRSSSTPAKLRKMSASLQSGKSHATLTRLCAEANELAAGWRQDNAAELMSRYRQFVAALAAFDDDHQLGIFAGGHRALAAAAQRQELLYKPCGAGGGDVGVALALDPASLARFVAQAADQGFAVLDLALGVSGLQRKSELHRG